MPGSSLRKIQNIIRLNVDLDLSYLITDKGVFSKFKDLNFFLNFKVCSELGTITWLDEIDIAPESLYSKVTGILPDWVEVS